MRMDTDQLLRKAISLLNRQKTGQAKAICRKVLKQQPDNFNAQHLFGVLALKEQDYVTAETALLQATRLPAAAKYQAQAWNNLALSRCYAHQLSQAFDAASEAIRLDCEQPSFWLNRAMISENRHAWPQAEEDCRAALALQPDNTETLTRLAITLRQQGETEQAAALLQAHQDALLNSQDPDILGEWALLACLNNGQARVAELCQLYMSQQINIAATLADYAAEEHCLPVALHLYQLAAEYEPDNDTVQHMLHALQGKNSLQAPRRYVQGLYDRHAEQFEQQLVSKLHYTAPQLIAEQLAKTASPALDTVLDLGCGTGLVGKALLAHFSIQQLTGVDLSRKMLEQAQQKAIYHRLVHASLLDHLHTEPAEQASLVVAADVLIYLGALDTLFSAVHRHLQPEGRFMFTVEVMPDAVKPPDYRLLPSGRYQHSEHYLRTLAAAHNLELTLVEHFPLREEHQQQIDGLLICACKQPRRI